MNLNKLKLFNFYLIILLIIFIAYINVIDVSLFLNNLNFSSNSNAISIQDIVIYTIYGLNSFSRVAFIDVIRFSLPFLLCITFICAYLTDIINNKNVYINLIRYKSYNFWLKKNILKLIIIICTFFFIYYFSIISISMIYSHNNNGFSDVFIRINININSNINFFELVFYQYLLSISFCINLATIIITISFISNSINKAFIYSSSFIIIISTLGKYNIFNPIMLSKHNIINNQLIISPKITLIINILIYFITFYLLEKIIKILVRRHTL